MFQSIFLPLFIDDPCKSFITWASLFFWRKNAQRNEKSLLRNFVCPIQNVFLQVIFNGFLSVFCVLLLSFWIYIQHCWRGRGEIILVFVHIWLSSNNCNTVLFRHGSRFGVFFWDPSLLFPLTKFCLKGTKSIMCLIKLQYVSSSAPKKAVSLLCVQCNDSMKCSTLNTFIFQWIETLVWK